MPENFHAMEESIKSFLIEAQTDNYNSRNAVFHKYNNLKVFMDPKKNLTPHFIVRIGISESMYSVKNGELLSGGLGADERYVRRWVARHLFRLDLDGYWSQVTKVKKVTTNEAEIEKAEQLERKDV